MSTKNPLQLKIEIADFSDVARNPALLKKLRELTLHPYSGMNHELDHLERDVKERDVKCKIITAYRSAFLRPNVLVGWALLSQEPTNFHFARSYTGFEPGQGVLFQVYVDPDYRRRGVGSSLVSFAEKHRNGLKLCICPWDDQSEQFYSNFEHYDHEKL